MSNDNRYDPEPFSFNEGGIVDVSAQRILARQQAYAATPPNERAGGIDDVGTPARLEADTPDTVHSDGGPTVFTDEQSAVAAELLPEENGPVDPGEDQAVIPPSQEPAAPEEIPTTGSPAPVEDVPVEESAPAPEPEPEPEPAPTPEPVAEAPAEPSAPAEQ